MSVLHSLKHTCRLPQGSRKKRKASKTGTNTLVTLMEDDLDQITKTVTTASVDWWTTWEE